MKDYEEEMPYEGSPLQRTRQLEDRIAELEAQLAEANDKRKTLCSLLKDTVAQRDEAEAQLAERSAQLKEVQGNWKKYENLVGRLEAAEARESRLRDVLQKVEAWMVSEGGPIANLWEDGLIGNYEYEDGGAMDWPTTLSQVWDLNIPVSRLGTDAREWQLEEVTLYRDILQALRPAEQPAEPSEENNG